MVWSCFRQTMDFIHFHGDECKHGYTDTMYASTFFHLMKLPNFMHETAVHVCAQRL